MIVLNGSAAESCLHDSYVPKFGCFFYKSNYNTRVDFAKVLAVYMAILQSPSLTTSIPSTLHIKAVDNKCQSLQNSSKQSQKLLSLVGEDIANQDFEN